MQSKQRKTRIGRNSALRPVFRRVASLLATVAALLAGPAAAETLNGRAVIATRMALPPGLTFEAIIEDISRAGAPAEALARITIENPGQPPIDFAIEYDPADLQPQAIYALRATIRRSDMLLFTTDTITPVLNSNAPGPVEVRLVPVGRPTGADVPLVGAHGLALPATFTGVLPCADCEGIRHHLDLWPDQAYHMRREWLGRAEGPLRRDEVGRWYADPARGAIVLHGASEMPLFWKVKGPDSLRQMDMAGNPIASDLPYELTSDGTLSPTDIEGTFLLGMMTYLADAAMFQECLTGRAYPIAGEGDYLALERAYLDTRAGPGAPLLVHVEGGLVQRPAMEGPDRTHLVVDRFIKTVPGETCAGDAPTASLTNTYWRIDSLMGQPVTAMDNRREPHLVLVDADGPRFRATVGCNQLIGGYERDGDRLGFGAAASTMMACPPPLDGIERQLGEALSLTRRMLLEGNRLDLLGDDGAALARLEAVYLR
ncbi:META domain-containing protein [Albidovulum sp.]|jgi:copper homeostasis protein (lipoprotein)|uniref:META domain-containing protein n=1 Tax=Albidovulum sp. TaxID=1872424 RepID=UPI00265AE9F2|nr:META domain-containing protein [uncultured Defluviimonas sp.]